MGWGDGFRMIEVHYIQAHLLLCGLVPNRPGLVPVCGLEVGYPCQSHVLSLLVSSHTHVLPEPVNVPLFGNRAFTDVTKMRSLGWALYQRGNVDTEIETHRKRPCDKTGRDWRDVATSQGTQGALAAPRSWRRKGRSLLRAFQGCVALLTF